LEVLIETGNALLFIAEAGNALLFIAKSYSRWGLTFGVHITIAAQVSRERGRQ
jgi:hypothetical protein